MNRDVREVKRSSLLTTYSSCTSGKCEWERRLSIRFFHNPIVSVARGDSSEEQRTGDSSEDRSVKYGC